MRVNKLIVKKSYEHVEHVLHRHPVTFIPTLVLFSFLLVAPLILLIVAESSMPNLLVENASYAIAVLLISGYYLSIILFMFARFIDFYLDMWIVTNDRIVDVEQFGLFSRTISELDLFRIQDVTSDVHGFFPTIFHYGNVTVKTASTNINIVFKNIRHPNTIRERILRLAHEDRKYHYPQPETN